MRSDQGRGDNNNGTVGALLEVLWFPASIPHLMARCFLLITLRLTVLIRCDLIRWETLEIAAWVSSRSSFTLMVRFLGDSIHRWKRSFNSGYDVGKNKYSRRCWWWYIEGWWLVGDNLGLFVMSDVDEATLLGNVDMVREGILPAVARISRRDIASEIDAAIVKYNLVMYERIRLESTDTSSLQ
jgi:hypothetical protein